MNNVIVKSPWIMGNVSLRPDKAVQISVVAYEHSAGMPARFCAGLIPAVDLSNRLNQNTFETVVRVIDPTPIANYCNGWPGKEPQFRNVIAEFLGKNGVAFFFDEAEAMDTGAIEVLDALGSELESCADVQIADMVRRIKESGRKHGGNSGLKNAILYMAAHPFSWLDMYHSLIWKKKYNPDDFHFVNLMSLPEERFKVIREFLRGRRPDLCTKYSLIDRYTALCNTPCYIPLEGEPRFVDLISRGRDWCREHYRELATKSVAHKRAHEDFEALLAFLPPDRQ